MWTCPKCGREFKRTNQGHYCGRAPGNVDEYIEAQKAEARAHLTALRTIIQSCVPETEERVAWSMPVYKKDRVSISFAACNKHISLYIDADILERFEPELRDYTIKKNALYLPYAKELPLKAIEKLVKQSFAETQEG